MEQKPGIKIAELYQKFNETDTCRVLLERYRRCDEKLLQAVEAMTPQQREAVEEYLEVYYAMYDSLVEFVCTQLD